MSTKPEISRRHFLQTASLAAAAVALPSRSFAQNTSNAMPALLQQFEYGDIDLASELHEKQLAETHAVLMGISDDTLLKPLRELAGQSAPGDSLGGWYDFRTDLKIGPEGNGFAPACTFGQWISALARSYAVRPDPAVREKVLRLNRLQAETITGDSFEKNRFPTYHYDKLVCGLIDSHKYLNDPDAFTILGKLTDTAIPHFPPRVVDHTPWRPGKDEIWNWDESYTIAENLFLAYQRGAGERYRDLARQYLDDTYYNRLAEGQDDMKGRHAYSHVNSLSSCMQTYLTLGSEKHLRAVRNGFDLLARQSYATGGWGPDETLRAPDSDDLYNSLTNTHASFETPCGAYAHFKITRYLLRVTREARYGDSLERVMYNTVLGAKPLMADGRTFYYSDYNFKGSKVYRPDQHWACCSGTLPQVACDYRLNIYFRDPRAVWVNLYQPSTARWQQDGAAVALTQSTDYPYDSHVRFDLQTSHRREFTINFRIPPWANGALIHVNDRPIKTEVVPGSFAAVRREWKNGDRIEVYLPLSLRLEAIDPRHPETVALLHGPIVLFAITNDAPTVSRDTLLAAKRTSSRSWEVAAASGPLKMSPFTEIADEPYTTYVRTS